MGLPGRSSLEEDDSVKLWKMFILPLIMALLILAMPVSMAEGTGSAPAQGYRAMEDYTKVHWFVECGDQRLDITGATGQNTVLAVDATPQTSWTISAQFVRVRNSELVPFDGELDVTRHCSWESDDLTWDDGGVTLPEGEGVYTVTGRFSDEEGHLYVCEFRFDVSEDHVAPGPRLRARAAATTVEQKVNQLVQECQSKGFNTQYEKAVWFHDWLIYNANYDWSYTNYDADGVLLMGTGVCDSYSKAFKLLLDGVGIENERVTSWEMNHAWNIAKLDGIWCHIDCTWDDPGTGGDENHDYFGMSAALIGRDHTWSGSYPAAESLANYYPMRNGQPCFVTQSEFDSILTSQITKKANPIMAVYVGSDPDLSPFELFQEWMSGNSRWQDVQACIFHITQYSLTIEVTYWDSSEYTDEYEAVIPKGLTELNEEVFANTGFESIDLTNGHLTTIRSGAFAGCKKLARIRIPRSVTTIENGAFTGTENVVIVCADGSAAYRFAVANGLEYILE